MRLAVLKYQYVNPKPSGMPDQWPSEVREMEDDGALPGDNWVSMTKEEFASHIAQYQSAYDTWWASNKTTYLSCIKVCPSTSVN